MIDVTNNNENTNSNNVVAVSKPNNSLYNNLNLNAKSIESFESSVKSMFRGKDVNKRNHNDYRQEKIFELGLEYETTMKIGDFEKAINIAKKLIFFEKDSNYRNK